MKVYLEGSYIYKKRNTLLGGIIAVIIGLSGLFFSILEALKEPSDPQHPILTTLIFLSAIVITILISLTGFWLLYSWLTNKRLELIIDESGIRYGKKFQPWENIKWVFYKGKSENETFLVYQSTSSWFDQNIPISKCLSTGELNHLFSQLKSQVARSHPHLKID